MGQLLSRPTIAADDPNESEHGGKTPQELWRNLLLGGSFFSLFFICLNRSILPRILHRLSLEYRSMNKMAQRKATVSISSSFHHLMTILSTILSFYRDWNAPSGKPVDYSLNRLQMLFSVGYFIADTLEFESFWANLDFLLHHFIAVAIATTAATSYKLVRWLPHLMVTEVTSIFLNNLWWRRQVGQQNTFGYYIQAAMFVMLFALVRLVWLPVTVWYMFKYHKKELDHLRLWKWLLPLACVLQFAWFQKIVQVFMPVVLGLLHTYKTNILQTTKRLQTMANPLHSITKDF